MVGRARGMDVRRNNALDYLRSVQEGREWLSNRDVKKVDDYQIILKAQDMKTAKAARAKLLDGWKTPSKEH